MNKFRTIPSIGRGIITVAAVGVFAIALMACAASYTAIYRLVDLLDLFGKHITLMFPLLIDAAFIVAELAAILGGIMRTVTRSDEVSPGWPALLMVLCAVGTLTFNVAHAYLIGGSGDPLTVWRMMAATVPPILMIVSFQVLIAITRWTMLHLGRPEQAFIMPGTSPGMTGSMPGTSPEQARVMPGTTPVMPGTSPEMAKGQKAVQTREYLAGLDTEELATITRAKLAVDMAELGVPVDERYAGMVLGKFRANGKL